jgi:branched-chain amino acid transport system permease protein
VPNYDLSNYLQFILSGLSTGSIYVLVALGVVTIYSVTGIVNLAQGEYCMLGAMLAVTFTRWGLPLALAAGAAVVSVTAIGVLIERLTVQPARAASSITLIMITVGVSIVVRGVALLAWGTSPHSLPSFTKGPPLDILGAAVSLQRLWILGTAAVTLLVLYFLLERTLLGKAVRACAINRQAAGLMGIAASQMSALVFALSAALGAVGGIVIAPLMLASYDMGLMLGLKGFVAAVIGGLTSLPGAVIGGLLLGVIESLGAGLISSGFKDAIAFLVLLLVIFARSGRFPNWLGRRPARAGSQAAGDCFAKGARNDRPSAEARP